MPETRPRRLLSAQLDAGLRGAVELQCAVRTGWLVPIVVLLSLPLAATRLELPAELERAEGPVP